MVLESFVSTILSYILDKYVEHVDTKNLKLALLSGKASLSNISLKKDALIEVQLPFEIKQGKIQQLSLKIPYMKLKSSPTEVEINQIFVLGEIAGSVLIEKDMASKLNNNEKLDIDLGDQDIQKGDIMNGLVGTVINNLKVKINDIHIRIESYSGGKKIAFGVMVDSISAFTVDENLKEVFVATSNDVIRKVVSLQGLSIYLDPVSDTLDNDDFINGMKQSMSDENHNYILKKFGIQGVLFHSIKKDSEFENIIKFSTNIINLAFNKAQFDVMKELQFEQARFNRRRFFINCGKPDRYPRSQRSSGLWWRFFYNCAMKKKNPILFDTKKAIVFLKNRRKHLNEISEMLLNPNQSKDKNRIEELSEKYGSDIIVLFREYAKMTIKKNLKKDNKLKIDKNDIEALLVSEKTNTCRSVALKNKLEFIVSALHFSLNKDQSTKLATFKMNTFQGDVIQDSNLIKATASISEIFLYNNLFDNKVVLRIPKGKEKYCASMGFISDKQLNENKISFNGTSPEIYADFDLLKCFMAFLSSPSYGNFDENEPVKKKRDNTILEIEDLLSVHKNLNLNVHLDSPSVIIPTKNPIILSLGNIDINTIEFKEKRSVENIDSYFDTFILGINGFKIMVGEHSIINPIDLKVQLIKSFIQLKSIGMIRVSLNIPSIEFQVTRDDYLNLLSLNDLISDINNEPQLAIEYENQLVKRASNNNLNKTHEGSQASFILSCTFDKLSFALLDSSNINCIYFEINKIQTNISAILDKIDCNFLLQWIFINGYDNDILNFGSLDKEALNIKFLKNCNDITLSLVTSQPTINVDLHCIQFLLKFFEIPFVKTQNIEKKNNNSNERQPDQINQEMNQYVIEQTLKNHNILRLNINIAAPIIHIPNEKDPISIHLGSLIIKTLDHIPRNINNTNSFYDRFLIEFKNFSLMESDEYLCSPFSTSVEIDKSFIEINSIEKFKLKLNIPNTQIKIKKQQILNILRLVDSFSSIFSKSNSNEEINQIEENERIYTQDLTPYEENEEYITKSSNKSKQSISFSANVSLNAFEITLINADDSIQSYFLLKNLYLDVSMKPSNIFTNLQLNSFNIISKEKTLLNIGSNEQNAINLLYEGNLNEKSHNISCKIINPLLSLDFIWIFEMKEFFEIKPNNQEANTIEKSDRNTKKIVVVNDESKVNDNNIIIPKINGDLSIINPVVSLVLIGKQNIPIKLSVSFDSIYGNFNENQKGSFGFNNFKININERQLLKQLSICSEITFGKSILFALEIPEISFAFQSTDFQLFKEVGEYIPAVLMPTQKQPEMQIIEVHNNEENMKQKGMFEFNILLKQFNFSISEKEQKIFDFVLNSFKFSMEDNSIQLKLESLSFQEYISSNHYHLIFIDSPLLLRMQSEQIDINLPKIEMMLKQESLQKLISMISPTNEQILDYTKQPVQEPTQKTTQQQSNKSSSICLKMDSLDIDFLSDEIDFGKFNLGNTIITMDNNKLIVLKLSKIFIQVFQTVFLKTDIINIQYSKEQIGFKTDTIDINCNFMEITKFIEFFNVFIIPSSKNESVEVKESKPISVPSFMYNVEVLKIQILLQNKFTFLFENLFVKSQTSQSLVVSLNQFVFSKEELNMLKLSKLNIPIILNLINKTPQISNKSDEVILLQNQNTDCNILDEINITTAINLFEIVYCNDALLSICDLIKELINMKPKQEEEVINNENQQKSSNNFNIKIELQITDFDILFAESPLKFQISKIVFKMDKNEKFIAAKSLKFTQNEENTLYPKEIISTNNAENSFEASMNLNKIHCKISSFNVFANYNALSMLISILMKCPFLSYKFTEVENNKNVQIETKSPEEETKTEITIDINDFNFLVPIMFEKSSDLLKIAFSLEIKLHNDLYMYLTECNCSFLQFCNMKEYKPFIMIPNLCIVKNKNKISIITHPTTISICPLDINYLSLMINGLLLFVNSLKLPSSNKSNNEYSENENTSDEKSIINLSINEFVISLNKERVSEVSLFKTKINPIDFSIDFNISNEINFEVSSFDYLQEGSLYWRRIIEPISIKVKFSMLNKTKVDIYINNSLNINLGFNVLQELTSYIRDINKSLSVDSIQTLELYKYRIVNSTGNMLDFMIENKISIQPDSFQEFDISSNTPITIMINDNPIKIIGSSLYYPMFLSDSIIAYKKETGNEMILTISSLVQFQNNTSIDIYLMKKNKRNLFEKIIMIPSGKNVSLPNEVSTKELFSITCDPNITTYKYSTFSLKYIRKLARLIPCLIDNNEINLVVSGKYQPVTNILMVKINSQAVIHNNIPLPLSVCLYESKSKFIIEPYKSLNILSIDTKNGYFKGYYALSKGPFSRLMMVSTKDGDISPVNISIIEADSCSVSFAVETTSKFNGQQKHFNFYPPAIVFNRSNKELFCVDENINQILAKFFPRKPGANPNADGILFYGIKEYFEKRDKNIKLTMKIFMDTVENISDISINCLTNRISDVLLIRKGEQPNLYTPLFCNIKSAEPYSHSSIVTITPYLKFKNCFKNPIYLQPLFEDKLIGDPITFESEILKQIDCTTKDQCYGLKFDLNKPEYFVICLSSPIHSTFFFDNLLMELNIQTVGTEIHTYIKPATIPQPLMITNLLEENIKISQIDKQCFGISYPETTSIVSYKEQLFSSDLQLYINDKIYDINIVDVNTPMKIDDNYYEIVTNPDNTKTIIVSKDPIQKEKHKDMEFSLNINLIQFSLLDNYFNEICLLTISNITFEYICSEFTTINFIIHSLQLDDLHPLAVLRVALAGYPQVDEENLLEFKSTLFPNNPLFTSCKDISFTMQPIILFLDFAFVSDLLYLFQHLFINSNNIPIEEPKPNEEALKPIVPFTAKSFIINQIVTTLFIRSKTSRPNRFPRASLALRVIPDITNGHIVLPAFEFTDCTLNNSYIQKEIISPMIKSGISQGFKLLFKTDIFSSSTGNKRYYYSKSINVINLENIGSSLVFSAGEAALNVTSKLLHFVSFDAGGGINRVNITSKDTFKNGMHSLKDGFVDGFTGIVMQPIQMSQTHGALGAILGIGKGLIGVVTKPISGIVDASLGTFSAARKFFSGQDDDVIPPIRLPHALPMINLMELYPNISDEKSLIQFQDFLDGAQFAFQIYRDNFFNETIELFVHDKISNNWIGITQRFLFYITNDLDISFYCKLQKICSCSVDENDLVLKVKKGIFNKTFEIKLETQNEATKFYFLANYRSKTFSAEK